MLILPPGHAETLKGMRRLTVREKRLVQAVLALVAALLVGVLIALASSGQSSARGCIHLTIPGPVGAQELDECGARARDICSTVRQSGAFNSVARNDVVAACRTARLPVG